MLHLKVTIEVQELDASNLVTQDIYDDKGNIVGLRSDAEYRHDLKAMEGRIFFGLTASVGDKAIRIHSHPTSGNPDTERNERAHALAQGFMAIGDSIYKNFAP